MKIIRVSLLLILCAAAFFLLANFIRFLPLFDFVEYWSAGKLNLDGKNPYGMEELYDLQTQLGWDYPDPLISWNPPWAQFFLMPMALLPYQISRTLWLLLSISIALYAAQQTWRMYGGPPAKKWTALTITITFSPFFFNLMLGQISPLILLGLIGLWKVIAADSTIHWKNGLLAGFFASWMAIKPQITLILLATLLLWALQRRIWAIPIGYGLSLLLETATASLFNPAITLQYLQALQEYPPNQWATPTLGYYLRVIFGLEKFWLQMVPSLLGFGWLIFYWQKKKLTWDWMKEMPLIILAGIVSAAYSWVHDQVILIPMIVLLLIWFTKNKPNWLASLIGVFYGLINLSYLILHFKWDDSRFFWMSIAFVILYLPVQRYLNTKFQSDPIKEML